MSTTLVSTVSRGTKTTSPRWPVTTKVITLCEP